MAATSGVLPIARSPAGQAASAGSSRFDAAVVLAELWFIGGLLVDGWAHNHLDLSREGFFTPYHALFYSGFAATAAVILVRTARNRRAGETLRAAIPRGYDITLAGLGIFAVGGVLDMLWHIAFGVEQDLAALFSPTHLLLAVGVASILSGPIRAGIARDSEPSFRLQWPALVSLALFATLVTFFLMWAFGITAAAASAPAALFPHLTGRAFDVMGEDRLARGITAIALRSLVIVGVVLWAARRFRLPRGAAALLIVVPSTLIGAMLIPEGSFVALQFASAFAAGLVAEIFLIRGLDLRSGSWKSRAFAFALPLCFWVVYVALTAVMYGGLWWNAHVTAGAPVIGGLTALLLELVSEPKAVVATEP
jgi:hypothetical protein